MKKTLLSEELKRIHKLAGLIKENEDNDNGWTISHTSNEDDAWVISHINKDEVENFIDYLEGWDLMYEDPIDLGNGTFSINHEKETDEVLRKMNHQDMEDRISDMNDPRNYYDD